MLGILEEPITRSLICEDTKLITRFRDHSLREMKTIALVALVGLKRYVNGERKTYPC